ANLLGEREEREHECDDDAAEGDAEPVGPATSAERAANASAWQRGPLDDPGPQGQPEDPRTCTLVDGHLSVAEDEADARTARIEEAERIGLRRAPIAELEVEPLAVLGAVLAFPHLVLASAVGLAAAGLMAFAHGSSFPGPRWLTRRVARRRADARSGLVGWRRPRRPLA